MTIFNHHGNRLWSRLWGQLSREIVGGVDGDHLGNIFVTSRHQSDYGADIGKPVLTMFDPEGNLLFTRKWAVAARGAFNTNNGGIGVDRFGDVYVVSYSQDGFDGYVRPGTLFLTKWFVGDSNTNGIADSWEIEHFGDLSQSAGDDYDGDGMTNLEEFIAGTDSGTSRLGRLSRKRKR